MQHRPSLKSRSVIAICSCLIAMSGCGGGGDESPAAQGSKSPPGMHALGVTSATPMTRYVVRNIPAPSAGTPGTISFPGYRYVNSSGDLVGTVATGSPTSCQLPFKYSQASHSSELLDGSGSVRLCQATPYSISDSGFIVGLAQSPNRYFDWTAARGMRILPDDSSTGVTSFPNNTYTTVSDLFSYNYSDGAGNYGTVFGNNADDSILTVPSSASYPYITVVAGAYTPSTFLAVGPTVVGGAAYWIELGTDGSRKFVRSFDDLWVPHQATTSGDVIALHNTTYVSTPTYNSGSTDAMIWNASKSPTVLLAPQFSISPVSNEISRGTGVGLFTSGAGGHYIVNRVQISVRSYPSDFNFQSDYGYYDSASGETSFAGSLAMLPAGVSDAGVVAGISLPAGQPVVWMAGQSQLTPINSLIVAPPPGFSVNYVFGIGDAGHIVALANTGLVLLVPENLAGTLPTAPVVGGIATNFDPGPVPAGSSVNVQAGFNDVNLDETHTAVIHWGDGASSQGIVTEAQASGQVEGRVTGSHVYPSAGIYTVSMDVSDGRLTSSVSREVVVYDPAAGFVTGSGTIVSPVGAYAADPSRTGVAQFSFVSMYKKGAKVPTGDTSFTFRAAGLNFASSSYDWLVVSGTKATYKGTGSINGTGNYKFQLAATDNGSSGDAFRIKIWHYDETAHADVVDYDNQSNYAGSGLEGTALQSGQIVIHR